MSPRIGVIGGGISGLSTVEALTRRMREAGQAGAITLFEAEASVGGKIGSTKAEGFVVEHGPHGFLGKEPKAMALIERLGLSKDLLPADEASARRFVVREGRLRELPASPPAFLASDCLSALGKARVMLEPLQKKGNGTEESVRAFAERRIGAEAAQVLVDAMVTGIYGGDPEKLSVRAAFPRLVELEATYGSLIKAQIALARAAKASGSTGFGGPGGTMYSFGAGLEELIRALSKSIEDLRTATRIERLTRKGGAWLVEASGISEVFEALVITTPAYEAARLLGPLAEDEARRLTEIRYAPVAVVVHGFQRAQFVHPLRGFGFLVPGCERRQILGSIWASSVFPRHAPDSAVMLRTLLGGMRRPELAEGSDDELSERARLELVQMMGLPEAVRPSFARVLRWPQGIPQYEIGHAQRVEAADAIERKAPGVFLSGNALRGVALIQCIADADRVAPRVLEFLARPAA